MKVPLPSCVDPPVCHWPSRSAWAFAIMFSGWSLDVSMKAIWAMSPALILFV